MKLVLGRSHRTLKKAVSLFAAAAFFANYVLADAWAAIGPGQAPYSAPAGDVSIFSKLDVDTFSMPENFGEVKDKFKGSEGMVIVHIQDAHCNPFAQHRVAEIIEYLNREYGIRAVNLEGAAGGYDLGAFTSISGEAIRREVADYFVDKGEINGAEFYAINNPDSVDLWGIEDKDLYIRNLQVYRDSLKTKAEVDRHIAQIDNALGALKKKLYTPDLSKMDEMFTSYKSGASEFREYISFLVGRAETLGMDLAKYANIRMLVRTMQKEKDIDFKKANSERDALVQETSKWLSANEKKDFLGKSLDFKTKKISPRAFYEYILKKAASAGVSTERYQNLIKYASYVSDYESIERSKVMVEMTTLERDIKEKLFKSDEQRRLDLLSRNLAIEKNMFEFSLTKDDYKYYVENEKDFDTTAYLEFIRKENGKKGIKAAVGDEVLALDQYRAEISAFFDYSLERDDAFMKNLRYGVAAGGVRGAILMTGGFHTENLCELFRKKGISYISIMPRFTIEKDFVNPYFGLLAGGNSDVESMLRSVIAKSSMLQIASHLSGALGDAVWGPAGMVVFKAAVYVEAKMRETGGKVQVTGLDGKPVVLGESGDIKLTMQVNELLKNVGYDGELKPIQASTPPATPIAGPGASTPGAAAHMAGTMGMSRTNEPVGKYIEKQILSEFGKEFDISGKSQAERQNILKEMVKRGFAFERDGTVFIKIKGLAGEGQYAHIGFGRTYGSKVAYIDADFAASETVIGHELEEFKLWENALKADPVLRAAGLTSLAEIRGWMLANINNKEVMGRMFDLAERLHTQANGLHDVSRIGVDGIDEFRGASIAAVLTDAEIVDQLIFEAQGKGQGKGFNLQNVILPSDDSGAGRVQMPRSLPEFFLRYGIRPGTGRFDTIVNEARARVVAENAGKDKDLAERAGRLAALMEGLTQISLEKFPENRHREALVELKDTLLRMFGELSVSQGIRGVRHKEDQLAALMQYVFEKLIAQDEDDLKLPFTPHGAKHSLLVAGYMAKIVNASSNIRDNMEKFYGGNYRNIAFLLGLLHDIGYAGLEDAAKELGIKKLPKGYHADLGIEMVEKSIGPMLVGLFGMDKPGSRPGKTILNDFLDAILLHGADKKSIEQEGKKGTGDHKYTPASEADNPLLLLTRMADNIDISRDRLREWQKNPWFIRILHNFSTDKPLKKLVDGAKSINKKISDRKKLLGNDADSDTLILSMTEKVNELNKEINKRVDELREREIEKLKERHRLAVAFRNGDLDARNIFAAQFLLDPNDPAVGMLLNQLASKNFEKDFKEIEKSVKKMDYESLGHFIGALAVRDVKFSQDPRGNLVISAELTGEADEPLWRDLAEYQINGNGRTNFALRSLTVGSKVVQIEDIIYTSPKHVPGETGVYKGDTVAQAVFKNLGMETMYIHDGELMETPLAAASVDKKAKEEKAAEKAVPAAQRQAAAEKQVEAAKNVIGDFRSGVADWIITPGNEETISAKKSVDTATGRKFRKEYGSDTTIKDYNYNANMSDQALANNLRSVFEKVMAEMLDPKLADKKPRALAYVPAENYALALKVLASIITGPAFEAKLKGMGIDALRDLANRITIIKEADMPENGVVDEVMHTVGGKGLLNAERFRQGDYGKGVKMDENAKARLAAFFRSFNPDLSDAADVIEQILEGKISVKITPIDFKEIQEWKDSQDQVLMSL